MINGDLAERKRGPEALTDDPEIIIVSDIVFAYHNQALITEL
jgi:hypothetical protein